VSESEYALGRSAGEYDRLIEQAQVMRPLTERMLCAAGVRPGMHVLDVVSLRFQQKHLDGQSREARLARPAGQLAPGQRSALVRGRDPGDEPDRRRGSLKDLLFSWRAARLRAVDYSLKNPYDGGRGRTHSCPVKARIGLWLCLGAW
jgi:hypothetical protein